MKTTIDLNNDWRKVASAIYKKTSDSKILGQAEVDVTDLEAYVAKKRKNGVKITITHVLTLAAARALKYEVPELNVYLKRGKIIPRPQIDAVVSVLLEGSVMGSVKIPNADQVTIYEALDIMADQIKDARSGIENKTMDMKSKLGAIPWPFRGWVFDIIMFLLHTLGFSSKRLGITPNNFGSFMVSNVGTLGLDLGFPSLMPISNISFVLMLGAVHKRPWVVNDEVVPRKIMWLGSALDHRVCDGSHGGRLFRYLKYIIQNPHLLETKPEA
jgi:pyruvate/2-oxoglutarate dehydrogenase complex dihydrolipoamide acyltransferase (E2) component